MNSKLPTGTVTFLFTDIEGSTTLWQQHPQSMKQALARHHEILQQAIQLNNGYVFQIIGDAFCAAFHTASDALASSLDAQRALRDEPWSGIPPIRVRMAIHTGAADIKAGDFTTGEYVSGLTLSRAARLLSAGHGGQILLSMSAFELTRDHLPDGVTLRDMGAQRLKDLIRPEQIFQVITADLPSEFPALKTLDSLPNNLPLQLTSFVGREKAIEEIREIMLQTRLVTVTGAGGSGKTRLSLQVAADLINEFTDGVWFVDLTPLSDSTFITQAIAAALNLVEAAGRPLLDSIADYLRRRELLIVLDNCEHMVEACARIVDHLLGAAPRLKIIATSRESLGIAGERSFSIPSLSLPDTRHPSPSTLSQYEAVRLFIDRATAVKNDFTVTDANAPAILQICHRLDGIPLAIELAAARVKMLNVEQIAARLDDSFHLLSGGSRTASPQHKTLLASIEWSYNLLSEAERRLFDRLSIFAGGWNLKAAEQVCANQDGTPFEVFELLSQLVNKSLVVVDESSDEVRYHFLQVIRLYTLDKLAEAGEAKALRDKHLNWFLGLAEESNPKLQGAEQVKWLNLLDADHENFRAALTWAIETAPEQALHLAERLSQFWTMRSYRFEAREWLKKVLSLPATSIPTALRARALGQAARHALNHGDRASAKALLEDSLAICKHIGEKHGLALTLDDLGQLATFQNDFTAAEQMHRESLTLCREQGDRSGMARAFLCLGKVAAAQGNWIKATELFQQSLKAYREPDGKAIQSAYWENRNPAHELGFAAENQGDFIQAQKFLEEGLALEREAENLHQIAWALRYLGNLYCRQGDGAHAKALFEESLTQVQLLKDPNCMAHSLTGLARVAEQAGDDPRAIMLAEEALALYEKIGIKYYLAETHSTLGRALLNSDVKQAMYHLKSSLAFWHESRSKLELAEIMQGFASAYLMEGMIEIAVRFFAMADAVREAISFPMTPWEQATRDEELSKACAQCDKTKFNLAWAEGRAMTIEQVVEYAQAKTSS